MLITKGAPQADELAKRWLERLVYTPATRTMLAFSPACRESPHALSQRSVAVALVRLAVLVLAGALMALAAIMPHPARAQVASEQLTGPVPQTTGFGLVTWSGGSVAALRTAAIAQGCPFVAAWVIDAGKFVGYVYGAPEIINVGFLEKFPDSILPSNQPLLLVCRAPAVGTPSRLGSWGVFDPAFPFLRADLSPFASFSAQIGRYPSVLHWYVEAAGPYGDYAHFGHPGVTAALAAGGVPLITWELWANASTAPGTYWSLDSVANGVHDGYFQSWALGIKAEPGTVLLRPLHEMNLSGQYPWSVHADDRFKNRPAQFVAAWRHIVDLFNAQGVTNVRWVFNVGGDLTNNPLPDGTYPGSNYVDYIGADMYDTAPPGSVALDAPLIAAIDPSKPLLHGEVGGTAAWITSELSPYMRTHVATAVWFNGGQWRLDASRETALKAILSGLP